MEDSSNRRGTTTPLRKRRLLLRKKISCRSGDDAKSKLGSAENFSFEPEWGGAIEGYVVRLINKNFWRFKNHMAFDDVYQEAYIKFLELKERYTGTVDSPKWFMSLYKTSLQNKITDFANLSNRLGRQVCFTELGDYPCSNEERVSFQESLIGSLESDGPLDVDLSNAPDEVRKVFVLLSSAPPELLSAMTDTWNANGKRKEGGNQFLCKMLGYDHSKVDLVETVHDYLET